MKHRFEDLLQKDLDGPRTKESRQAVNVDSSPELPGPPDDDVPMSPARTTGKRTAADRTGPPTTPAAKRKSDSGSSSRRWWVDLDPLSLDQAPKAWHKDLLEALLTEWGDHNMLRLQQWMATHGTEEMKTTLDSLSTSNTTTRQLHSGLRTLLRGACVPPLIFGATAPKGRVTLASSSLNDLAKNRHYLKFYTTWRWYTRSLPWRSRFAKQHRPSPSRAHTNTRRWTCQQDRRRGSVRVSTWTRFKLNHLHLQHSTSTPSFPC